MIFSYKIVIMTLLTLAESIDSLPALSFHSAMAKKVDFEAICRTCLGTENLNPIFLNPEKSMRYSIAIFMIAGLKVEMNDGLPQNMCKLCLYRLNCAIKYRTQCKNAESQLIQIKSEMEINDFETDSRHLDSEVSIKDEPTGCSSLAKNEDQGQMTDLKTESEDFLEHSCVIKDDNLLEKNEKLRTKRKSKRERKNIFVISRKEGKVQRVNCDVCQKELSIKSIDRHIQNCHPGVDGSRVKCELCDSRVTHAKMNRHMLMMHGSGSLKCRYCHTEFQERKDLVGHVTSCVAKKRGPDKKSRELVECDVCHKAMQRRSLPLHKSVKHKGLGPVCEHCGIKFGNSIRLHEHYRAKHGYEKFKCKICVYETASELALRNHERRHRGEKPFVCESCGAGFHAAYLLAQHRHSHRTERLFKCTQCPSSFKSNNSLLIHKRSCHSTKMFACKLCARTYRWRHYVIRHLRLVHQYKVEADKSKSQVLEIRPSDTFSIAT